MRTGRGKLVAWCTTALGLAVLVASVIVFKDRLVEEWYLHGLRAQNEDSRRMALEGLARMGSARAIPVLFAILGSTSPRSDPSFWFVPSLDAPSGKLLHWSELPRGLSGLWEQIMVPADASSVHVVAALWEITRRSPKESARHLATVLRDDFEMKHACLLRHFSLALLIRLGADAEPSLPEIVGLVRNPLRRKNWSQADTTDTLSALFELAPEAPGTLSAIKAAANNDDQLVRRVAHGLLFQLERRSRQRGTLTNGPGMATNR
jgi:hypothetical protein